MDFDNEIFMNQPAYTLNEPIYIKDLLADLCYQLDHKIFIVLFLILFAYLFDYIIEEHLKSLFPTKKEIIERIKDIFNSLSFFSICYLLFIVYIQIGFTKNEWLLLISYLIIIFIGLIFNVKKKYKIRKNNGD